MLNILFQETEYVDVIDEVTYPASPPPASPPAIAGARPTDSEDSDQVYGVQKRINAWKCSEEEEKNSRKRRQRDAELWSDDESYCSSTYCQCTRSTTASSPLPRQRQTSALEDNIALVASRALVRLASKSIANSLLIMPSALLNAQCKCYSCRAHPPPTPHPAQQAYHQQQQPLHEK